MSESGGDETLSDRFASGDSINWDEIGSATVGSVVLLISMTIADGFLLIQRGVSYVFGGVSGFFSTVIALPFSRGAGVIETSASSFVGWLGFLGPLAFPVSVAVAVAMLSIILWGVSRFVR
jgi:hypothetical protein